MKRRPLSKKARAWNVEKRRIIRMLDVIVAAWEHERPRQDAVHQGRSHVRIDALRHVRAAIACDNHRVPL